MRLVSDEAVNVEGILVCPLVLLVLAIQLPPVALSLTATWVEPVPSTAIQYCVPEVMFTAGERVAVFQPVVGELMVTVASLDPGAPELLLYSPRISP